MKYCSAYPNEQPLRAALNKHVSITGRQLLVHQSGLSQNNPDEVVTTNITTASVKPIGSLKDDPVVGGDGNKITFKPERSLNFEHLNANAPKSIVRWVVKSGWSA